jgi:hypothetical protein
MIRHWARKMRELVPPPWRHNIRGRCEVESVLEKTSAGRVEPVIVLYVWQFSRYNDGWAGALKEQREFDLLK